MAITIAASPDTYSGAGMPIIFDVTSDRDTAGATTVILSNVGGGLVQCVTPSAHGYYAGDIITISNTTMDGTYSITTIQSTTTFRITTTYTAGDLAGNVTRLNNNFQVKAVITDAVSSAVLGTLVQEAISGTYSFEISDILNSYITNEPAALGGSTPTVCTDCYYTYGVTFTEQFDDENGLLKNGASQASGVGAIIGASTQYDEDQDLDDYIAVFTDTGKFLTNSPNIYMRYTDEFSLRLLCDSSVTSTYLSATKYDLAGATSSVSMSPLSLIGAGSLLVNYPINSNLFGTSGVSRLDIVARDQAGNAISETKTFYIIQGCGNGTRLYWLNPLGGWDAFTFEGEADRMERVVKYTYVQNNSTKKNYIKAVQGADSFYEYSTDSDTLRSGEGVWLGEVYRSTDVRVQDGTVLRKVLIINDGGLLESEDLVRLNINYEMAEGLK